jgi:hypothetical protein
VSGIAPPPQSSSDASEARRDPKDGRIQGPLQTFCITSGKALDRSVINFPISKERAVFPTPPRVSFALIMYGPECALSDSEKELFQMQCSTLKCL